MSEGARIKDEIYLTKMSIARAAEKYIRAGKGAGWAPNTIGSYKRALERLVEVCPRGMETIDLRTYWISLTLDKCSLGETDDEYTRRYMVNSSASRRTGMSKASLNIVKAAFRGFEAFCHENNYLSAGVHLMAGAAMKNSKKRVDRARRDAARWIVPYNQRENLLRFLGERHGRERAIAAMMIFGGRRWDDIKEMRIRDIDVVKGEYSFINNKAGGVMHEAFPMLFTDFVDELRRWLAWYSDQFDGVLEGDWYLFPARVRGSGDMYPGWAVDPTKVADYQSVRAGILDGMALVGAPAVEDGRRQAIHSLRHSCAHWLSDIKGWRDEDISWLLDHEDPRTTKTTYLAGREIQDRIKSTYGDSPADTFNRRSPKSAAGLKARKGWQLEHDSEVVRELSLVA